MAVSYLVSEAYSVFLKVENGQVLQIINFQEGTSVVILNFEKDCPLRKSKRQIEITESVYNFWFSIATFMQLRHNDDMEIHLTRTPKGYKNSEEVRFLTLACNRKF